MAAKRPPTRNRRGAVASLSRDSSSDLMLCSPLDNRSAIGFAPRPRKAKSKMKAKSLDDRFSMNRITLSIHAAGGWELRSGGHDGMGEGLRRNG